MNISRKDSFEFVIKLEKGSYFCITMHPLSKNRMMLLTYWGPVLTHLQEADVQSRLPEGMDLWKNGDGIVVRHQPDVDCGMDPLEALYSPLDENVSTKVVKIIQSYMGVVNKAV